MGTFTNSDVPLSQKWDSDPGVIVLLRPKSMLDLQSKIDRYTLCVKTRVLQPQQYFPVSIVPTLSKCFWSIYQLLMTEKDKNVYNDSNTNNVSLSAWSANINKNNSMLNSIKCLGHSAWQHVFPTLVVLLATCWHWRKSTNKFSTVLGYDASHISPTQGYFNIIVGHRGVGRHSIVRHWKSKKLLCRQIPPAVCGGMHL